MMFVDDLLFGGEASMNEWHHIQKILHRFNKTTNLIINGGRSLLLHDNTDQEVETKIRSLSRIPVKHISEGVNYLGYKIKPSRCLIQDWEWMIERFKKKLEGWKHR